MNHPFGLADVGASDPFPWHIVGWTALWVGVVAAVAFFIMLLGTIDDEEWTKIEGDCYLLTEENRSWWFQVERERTTYCPVPK